MTRLTTEKQHEVGSLAAWDALHKIAERVGRQADGPAALAGFLEVAMSAAYGMAPDKETAEELIDECADFAKRFVAQRGKGRTIQ